MKTPVNNSRHLQILKAYLVHGISMRGIEIQILRIPSPVRGGGFVAKGILNDYGVSGIDKGTMSEFEFQNRFE